MKPGTEQTVAGILAGYTSPAARVDEPRGWCAPRCSCAATTWSVRWRWSGDLVAALRHVAAQPEVRAVEEAINPYLEEARDLNDPLAARDFFCGPRCPPCASTRATPAAAVGRSEPIRHAFSYPARPGRGEALAEFLERQDRSAVADPASPLVRSTIFQRGDRVVRMVDMAVPADADPAAALGIVGPRAGAVLARLVRAAPACARTAAGRRWRTGS